LSESQTSFNSSYTEARLAALSDEELVDVVGARRLEYIEEAKVLAWAEVRRRGLESVARDAAAQKPKQHSNLNTTWLDVYSALLLTSAVAAPVVAFFVIDNAAPRLLLQLPYSGLQAAVGYGLSRRRLWAWYLNWVLMASPLVITTLTGPFGTIAALVSLLLNGTYLARRRRLFTRAPRGND